MYEQIARNKRRTVVYLVLFFVVWCGIGALIGWIATAGSASGQTAALVAGAVIAGLAALLAMLYTLNSGSSLVLSVSGAHPADPQQYQQLHDIVEALAIGDGLPKPAGVRDRRPVAQRVRDRDEPEPGRDHRDDRPARRS